MVTEPYTVYENGWIFKIKPPANLKANKILLLLHGWTGDENVMWIFARQLTDAYCILSPRGPIPADPSGYGWVKRQPERWSTISELNLVVDRLLRQVDFHISSLGVQTKTLDIIGFSQGCAMAYSIAAKYPQRIGKVAVLSGFIPDGCDDSIRFGILNGKEIFMAHGTYDTTIPIKIAHRDRNLLEQSGAIISYCEEAVGHKLGPGCFNSLRQFLSDVPN